MRNILEIKNLVVSYGGIEAVKGIDLKVEEGKIVTLIGSNGAGKSTTLKAVAGLVKPKSGEILLNGANLVGKSTDQIVSSGVTLVPEGRRVFENLTVAENLRIGAYLRKDSLADDLARVYDLFPRLKEREWQQAGTLSGGEQQMLAVGRALMAKPKLIMMDEPSLGLAPIVVRGIFEIIREINRQGITVLLIEQNANMALKIADWAYVMQTGSILMQGPGEELAANEQEMQEAIAAQKAAEEAAKQQALQQQQQQGGGTVSEGGSVSYPTTGGGVEGFNPIWPLPGVTYISAGYNGYPGHKGLDIAGPYGTPVVAAEDGQVIVANNYDSWGDSWGYYVLIYHNGTYTTRYAHLSSVAVSQGQYVTAGTVVGYEGATGNVTGPHLHFEVYQNGTRVDPMQFL